MKCIIEMASGGMTLIKFYDSSGIHILPQQFQRLLCWYY
jgi:hypothetical protein